ncbi:hypothetical protein BB559_004746 [Furculomyces boomerangus]|uniref:Uncharacterized protein n=2 Tax=Harpellales TaxID=61421 RepID=A0A2T9YD01_9FUNG|nr:hypothetical protein BB559_004746 [Furculomyces boomerangus]PVZ99241.1 hypothetical protein BB558_004735 [Smittium angustum]
MSRFDNDDELYRRNPTGPRGTLGTEPKMLFDPNSGKVRLVSDILGENRQRERSRNIKQKSGVEINRNRNKIRCLTILSPSGSLELSKLYPFFNENSTNIIIGNLGRARTGKSLLMSLLCDTNFLNDDTTHPIFKLNSKPNSSIMSVGCFITPNQGVLLDFPPVLVPNSMDGGRMDLQFLVANFLWSNVILLMMDISNCFGAVDKEMLSLMIKARNIAKSITNQMNFGGYKTPSKLVVVYNTSPHYQGQAYENRLFGRSGMNSVMIDSDLPPMVSKLIENGFDVLKFFSLPNKDTSEENGNRTGLILSNEYIFPEISSLSEFLNNKPLVDPNNKLKNNLILSTKKRFENITTLQEYTSPVLYNFKETALQIGQFVFSSKHFENNTNLKNKHFEMDSKENDSLNFTTENENDDSLDGGNRHTTLSDWISLIARSWEIVRRASNESV